MLVGVGVYADSSFGHADVYAIILLSTAVTVSSQLYEFVAFAAVLGVVTWIMLRLYLPTATKIKALVSDTAGSLVGLTAESLEGLEVIQAYQHEDYFVKVSVAFIVFGLRSMLKVKAETANLIM